jgi:hypothetical protein
MSESLSVGSVVRGAFLKIDDDVILAAVDTLDLRAHAKVSAVIGVPLRQLQQRRDVHSFAVSAPMVSLRALLELLAMSPLERIISILGDHAESPTYDQMSQALDALLAQGASVDEVVAVLAFAVSETFPAAPHCRRLLQERENLALPELPEVVAPSILAAPKVVSEEIRQQRKRRRDEERRRKASPATKRLSRPAKSKRTEVSQPDAGASSPLLSEPQTRRQLSLTPRERSMYDDQHALVGAVFLAEVCSDI